MELKLLTDRTVKGLFANYTKGAIKEIEKLKRFRAKPKPFKVIAHKTIRNGRKTLVYVEVNKSVHFVLDRAFKVYFKLRRDIPDKVILFTSLNEISNEIEKKGFIL